LLLLCLFLLVVVFVVSSVFWVHNNTIKTASVVVSKQTEN